MSVTTVQSNLLHPDRHPLLRKIATIAEPTEEERRALLNLPFSIKSLPQHADIVSDGDRPTQCALILEGFTCRYKLTHAGKRQIMSFHIPGDIPDLQSLYIEVMDHGIGAVAPSTVGYIPHDAIRDLIRRYPAIAATFWRDTLIDAAVFRQWMMGIGRRSAHGRIAHLLCELTTRFRAIGAAADYSLDLPITQVDIADSLGLTPVHVNRVLQELRRDDLIELRRGHLRIKNWDRLSEVAEFDPTYLHLTQTAA